MQNFEQLGMELERRGKTDKLKALAETEDVQRLGKMIDPGTVERAAKNGDSDALRQLLSTVLSTEEGKRLAQSVERLMKD